jgi:hypothetical protein
MLVLLAACGGDAAFAPVNSITLEELSPSELAALQQQEQAELARVEDRRQASAGPFDSLQSYWSSLGTNWKTRGPVVLCAPREYDGAVRIVGPEGGTLQAGAHTLVIPPGALDRPTVITAEMPAGLEVLVEFRPHGLEFLKRPKVTLDYAHCGRPGWFKERVAYLGTPEDDDPTLHMRASYDSDDDDDDDDDDEDGGDDDDEVLEWPESHDRGEKGQVDALINHFSRYAVAY